MRTTIKFLNENQVKNLEHYFKAHRHESIRIALIELMHNTGCRPDELIRIRFSDVNKETSKVTIFKGSKGSNARVCNINEELGYLLIDMGMRSGLQAYDSLIKIIGSEAETKMGLIRLLQRQWDKIRVALFMGQNIGGIYTLRHTYGKKIYDKKKDIKFLQLVMGHKSISSTAHYLSHITIEEGQDMLKGLVNY